MFFLELQNPVYVLWAFTFQFILLIFFAMRKANFKLASKYGWIVYALSLVGFVVSIQQINRGESWTFWVGGLIYLVWGVFGIIIEYMKQMSWRTPIVWKLFIPYVILYLTTVMFYWWPLGEINKAYWYGGAILFVINTILNITSHPQDQPAPRINQ